MFLVRSGILPLLLVVMLPLSPVLGLHLSGSTVAVIGVVAATELAVDITMVVWLRVRARGR